MRYVSKVSMSAKGDVKGRRKSSECLHGRRKMMFTIQKMFENLLISASQAE